MMYYVSRVGLFVFLQVFQCQQCEKKFNFTNRKVNSLSGSYIGLIKSLFDESKMKCKDFSSLQLQGSVIPVIVLRSYHCRLGHFGHKINVSFGKLFATLHLNQYVKYRMCCSVQLTLDKRIEDLLLPSMSESSLVSLSAQ